jgi:hypothetical protein
MASEFLEDTSQAAVAPLTTSIPTIQMDPRLQRIVADRAAGALIEATSSTGVDEISVIAEVDDLEAWVELSEVRPGAQVGTGTDGGSWIVTGRIPATRIERVRSSPSVRSLKAARPLQPMLAQGVAETGATAALLPSGNLSNGGRDVVVGIIDYGCDFAHRNFIGPGGTTRLHSIWHQGGTTTANSPFGYGREYRAAEIDAALSQPEPYRALGYGPAADTPTQRGSHGTHVMDIAAGNGGGTGAAGFAPQADLIFVDVSHSDLPWSGTSVVDSNFGDSVQLLEAVQYIFDQAGDRPCVINISLGTNGGPHDGTSLVERGIDRLLAARAGRAVTIAASNSFDDGIHASATATQDATTELVWRVPAERRTHKEMEIWLEGADQFDLEIIAPNGTNLGTIVPGANGTSTGSNGRVEVFAANRLTDPNNGDNSIGIYLSGDVSAGDWKVRLIPRQIASGVFHAWIERDNLSQSSFAPPHVSSHTLGSISCGQLSIAVGSYDAHKQSRPISWFSSAGPTRDGRQKPELSAPGHGVVAAHSRTRTGALPKNGTSMAAPAVAGVIALMFGEAQARGFELPTADLREILIAAARRLPPPGTAWDAQYGAGRIDAAAAVRAVMQAAQGGAAPPVSASATRASAARQTRSSAAPRAKNPRK